MFGITRDMLFSFMMRFFVLFTMIPVHECAHGFIADRLGDDTPRMQGRLTLNPLSHLDLVGSILLFFAGIGWGRPVSVDTRNFKHPRRDMALTALAGPVSNILMSLALLIVYKLAIAFVPAASAHVQAVADVFINICMISISLALFNLLPIPPLDGSKIIGLILPNKLYWGMLRYQRQISIVFMLLLFTGILSVPLSGASRKVLLMLDAITRPLDALILR